MEAAGASQDEAISEFARRLPPPITGIVTTDPKTGVHTLRTRTATSSLVHPALGELAGHPEEQLVKHQAANPTGGNVSQFPPAPDLKPFGGGSEADRLARGRGDQT